MAWREASYNNTLDLTKGYWQELVVQDTKGKTTFTTPFGKYRFSVMPFGLVGALSTFQRLMNSLFGDVPHCVSAYMDDTVIFSREWNQHLDLTHETLSRLVEAGLTVKMAK